MIASLADAWRWYESVRALTLAMRQLGKRHWNDLPWEGDLGRDERLRHLDAPELVDRSDVVLGDMDDLCVLLLFSVFESVVRARVLADVEAELPPLRHAALQDAIRDMREGIEHGSFAKVLGPFKKMDADLVEQVSQVRRYRNWVAHGRRGEPSAAVDPRTAYERLQRFLDQLAGSAGDASPAGPEASGA
jgi:hypothetical protein